LIAQKPKQSACERKPGFRWISSFWKACGAPPKSGNRAIKKAGARSFRWSALHASEFDHAFFCVWAILPKRGVISPRISKNGRLSATTPR
jgi:hypothetical protein